MEIQLSEIFKFGESDIVMHMMYDMKLKDKFGLSFDYVTERLGPQELKPFKQLRWYEGKNYNWAAIRDGELTLLVRHYQSHFTVYFRADAKEGEPKKYFDRYGCFTYYTDEDRLSDAERDARCDNRFMDIDESMPQLTLMLKGGNVHSLWNDHSFRRPRHVKVKNAWNGGSDSVSSINDFVFCCEELFGKHLELFAQKEMLEMVRATKAGDKIGGKYEVLEVKGDVHNDYYHGAGLKLKGTNGATSESWCDLYSLTRWYLKEMEMANSAKPMEETTKQV